VRFISLISRIGGAYGSVCRLGAAIGRGAAAARRWSARAAVLAALLMASLSAAQAMPTAVFPDKYGAIVVDANTGRVLFADRADLRRYPASLTKMMTLYLLFDAMKAGRVRLNSAIPISAYANGQPPTKLNLGAGQHIGAEAAAKALITKSANDIAVAIAEYLGGSESGFTRMMNLKARQLGMRGTHFANASGLPNLQNYSTARDLAILALALRRDFPQQYGLFRTTSFVNHGRLIRGHNRLVANMAGVDGIKTGYTRMSGFNLASSRQMGAKSIVAVVMGGKTSALRDSLMAGLLTRYMDKASSRRGFAAAPAAPAQQEAPAIMAAAPEPRIRSAAPATVAALARLTGADIPIPTAKITMNAVSAVPEAAPALIAQSAVDESDGGIVPIPRPDRDEEKADESEANADNNAAESGGQMIAEQGGADQSGKDGLSDRERDSAMLMMLASRGADEAAPGSAAAATERAVLSPAAGNDNDKDEAALDKVMTASLPAAQPRQPAAAAKKPAAAAAKPAAKGWAIQLTTARSAREARRIGHKTGAAVRRANRHARFYTEKTAARGKTYYHIRYSGFASPAAARQGCARLKKSGYKCRIVAL